MKKLPLLLSFLILFQSCYGYKSVNYNSIPIEKKQKVKVKGVGGTNIKGTLFSKNEEILTLDIDGQLHKISVSEIYEVKVRKFSFLKSYGLLVSITVVTAAIFPEILIGW